eukprot:2364899-Rhodomonas_salina.2
MRVIVHLEYPHHDGFVHVAEVLVLAMSMAMGREPIPDTDTLAQRVREAVCNNTVQGWAGLGDEINMVEVVWVGEEELSGGVLPYVDFEVTFSDQEAIMMNTFELFHCQKEIKVVMGTLVRLQEA